MLKKTVLLLVVLSLLGTIFLTGTVAASKDEPRIVFVTPLLGHPIWLKAKNGFDDASEDLGFSGDWVGPQGIDANAMIQQIENAIAQDVDGIISMALNPGAFKPVLERAKEAGIPVVLVNSDAPKAPRLAYVGTDPVNFGHKGAEKIMEKLDGEPAKVITMQSTMDANIANQMVGAYVEKLKNVSENKILVRESDNSDMMVAVQKFQNLLTTYPECNVIIGVAAEVGPAAAQVINEMNLKNDVTVMAIDDMDQTLEAIREGLVYGTLTQNFYRMGYQPSQILMNYIQNHEKPEKKVFDSGTIFVTKDNVDSYGEQMDDWLKK